MEIDEDPIIDGKLLLRLFPPFVRVDLVDDSAFCQRLGIELDGTLRLDQGEVRIRNSAFMTAARSVYADSSGAAQLDDEDGKTWTLTLEGEAGRSVITLALGEQKFKLGGLSALSPDRSTRLDEFECALYDAGLPPRALPQWRARLDDGPLENEEVLLLNTDLSRTPISGARVLDQELSSPTGKAETVVPPYRVYYERLCGGGEAASVEALANDVVPRLVADLLAWDRQEGARMALLLASHSLVIPSSGLLDLPPDEIIALADWAVEAGDLISKIGMIELGMAVLPSVPDLSSQLQTLVEQILELDPSDADGRLHLLMGALIFTYGELSRTKVLDKWPPFRRRFAALAQASLFERHALGRLDAKHFTRSALDERGHRFYLQVLVDMRLEPRWLPDYVGADQLKYEMVGRIHNAANRYIDNVPDGPLKVLLTGSESSGLRKHVHFPRSLLPGPLEGAETGPNAKMPTELAQILDESIASEKLDAKSVTALINLHGLFSIGSDKVDRVVALIRKAQHRFATGLDVETRDSLISGLAGVASATRNPALANDVRIMIRKNRVDDASPPSPRQELLTALMAAAAHRDLDAWIGFVGDWALELALTVKTKDDATALKGELETLCVIEPALRKSVGRAIAAADGFLKV